MDKNIYQILLDYIMFIQQQIENNQGMIAGISEQIEKSKRIRSNSEDINELNKLFEENYKAIQNINLYVQKQDELLQKFRKMSVVFAQKIEVEDISILEELLSHYESKEDYERCAILRDKISARIEITDKLKDISNKELPGLN